MKAKVSIRAIPVRGALVSIPLAPASWSALDEYCERENVTPEFVFSTLNETTPASLARAVENMVQAYNREAFNRSGPGMAEADSDTLRDALDQAGK